MWKGVRGCGGEVGGCGLNFFKMVNFVKTIYLIKSELALLLYSRSSTPDPAGGSAPRPPVNGCE